MVVRQVRRDEFAADARGLDGARVAGARDPELGALHVQHVRRRAHRHGRLSQLATQEQLVELDDVLAEARDRVGDELVVVLLEELRQLRHAELGRFLALRTVPVEDAQQRLVERPVERPTNHAAVLVDLGVRDATRAGHHAVPRLGTDVRLVERRAGAAALRAAAVHLLCLVNNGDPLVLDLVLHPLVERRGARLFAHLWWFGTVRRHSGEGRIFLRTGTATHLAALMSSNTPSHSFASHRAQRSNHFLSFED